MARGMLGHNGTCRPTRGVALRASPHFHVAVRLHRASDSMHRMSRRNFALQATESLSNLELFTVLDTEGFIAPNVQDGIKASVFAIFDDQKKIQFIGFSRDLDSSLKTVFTRRPDKTHFYKAAHLEELDQKAMMEQRDTWFEELGGPPVGNNLALERQLWQEPIASGAISASGNLGAAEEKAREMMELIKLRGCKEDFLADPEKLADGKILQATHSKDEYLSAPLEVDFLPTKKLSVEEIEERKAQRDAIARASRNTMVTVNGNLEEVSVYFASSFNTNGGCVFDITVGHDGRDTSHRVIVGRQYYEPFGVEAEEVVVLAMSFLISIGEARQTEGLLHSSDFPINYFSMSVLEQLFPEFSVEFEKKYGKLEEDAFWRFNRIHSYGPMYENPAELSRTLGGSFLDVEDKVEEDDLMEMSS